MVSHAEDCNCPFGGNCVLILIVMDNGLSRAKAKAKKEAEAVLILIVMDNGLSRGTPAGELILLCLNPYCNG